MTFLHMKPDPFIALAILCSPLTGAAGPSFEKEVRPLLERHCLDCHGDEPNPKGGVNLERYRSNDDVMRDRAAWGSVFEKIESRQMPPPKRESQPTDIERSRVLAWIRDIAARPDPALGVRDPGKPVLRRLTRLEYNNTVRDLLGLDTDVFMFPERLPLVEKRYLQAATGQLGDKAVVRLREYGGGYPVLLPQAGLPADSRAEHGFRNRGDTMNVSPLMLEQYVALAGKIVNHPDLPHRSRAFAELLGVEFKPRPAAVAVRPATSSSPVSPAVGVFGPAAPKLAKAAGSADNADSRFREDVAEAFREGRGGVFDGAAMAVVPHKNALIRVPFGDAGVKTLTINPDQDIWLAPFSTAEATSAPLVLANRTKSSKIYELTFRVEDGDDGEGIVRLAVCVVGRRGQTGDVTLTTRFSDSTEAAVTVTLGEGRVGTTFASFAAVPGETIRTLLVDGSKFSGEYVLLDDLGFITNGEPVVNARPPRLLAPLAKAAPKSAPTQAAPVVVTPPAPPAERLAAFLERAFRRPATDDERARFVALYESRRSAGKSEPDALRAAAQAALASPTFLYLSPSPRPTVPPSPPVIRALDGHELASRLSYFLWATTPDAELLALAKSGELSQPDALAAQTRRMLRDPRVRELGESFGVQWLRLDQLYTSKPDRDLFKGFYSGPQGKNTLHGAALVEALLLFETVLIEDRSILDFIAADYTWLNPALAKLYRIPLATEAPQLDNAQTATTRELKRGDKDANDQWHRVKLVDSSRGGFLTMSAPLIVTSLPFRTSPVKRGAWLLETVFNRPPSEPKIAFAVENDTREAAQKTSIRQRFESHRSKAACYSCHIRLDPPGFALERFDAIGAWRDSDGGAPVDARGDWNGHPFDGPAEYKALLARNPHEFIRGFIEHLLSYALGRGLEVFDMPAVDEIERRAASDGYRLGGIINGIVRSYPFRHVRNVVSLKP